LQRAVRFRSSDRSLTSAIVVLLQVYRAGPVTLHRVRAAVAVYLLIGFAFDFIYEAFLRIDPVALELPSQLHGQREI
jgi:hypothetical protein